MTTSSWGTVSVYIHAEVSRTSVLECRLFALVPSTSAEPAEFIGRKQASRFNGTGLGVTSDQSCVCKPASSGHKGTKPLSCCFFAISGFWAP